MIRRFPTRTSLKATQWFPGGNPFTIVGLIKKIIEFLKLYPKIGKVVLYALSWWGFLKPFELKIDFNTFPTKLNGLVRLV